MFLFVNSKSSVFDVFSYIRHFLARSSSEFNACRNRVSTSFTVGATDKITVSSANIAKVLCM